MNLNGTMNFRLKEKNIPNKQASKARMILVKLLFECDECRKI
jgi:hypothetical protein